MGNLIVKTWMVMNDVDGNVINFHRLGVYKKKEFTKLNTNRFFYTSSEDRNLNHKMNGAQKIHFVIKCLMIFRR